jgi:high frequency lysogenization protein
MSGGYVDQCIALAGMLQALEQLQHCARSGQPADVPAMDCVLEAVLRIDADSAEGVFGELGNLQPGLTLLSQHLSRRMGELRLEQARYAASLMFLERKLAAAPPVGAQLVTALQLLAMERAQRPVHDTWMLQRLAGLYVDHISPLGPRIMVSGGPEHLKAPANADRIRSLLLAGLRAAVLWRQCGGRRWKLVCFRSAMRRETEALLETAAA